MIFAFWPRRWYVPSRYSHVTILDLRGDTWLQIDVGREGADVVPFHSHDEVNDRLSVLTESCVLVEYAGVDRFGSGYLSRLSCVSFAIHYSGIRSRALLPGGLMRDLLRNGAKVIHDPEETRRVSSADPEPSPG